jgi:hypothetical protein
LLSPSKFNQELDKEDRKIAAQEEKKKEGDFTMLDNPLRGAFQDLRAVSFELFLVDKEMCFIFSSVD